MIPAKARRRLKQEGLETLSRPLPGKETLSRFMQHFVPQLLILDGFDH